MEKCNALGMTFVAVVASIAMAFHAGGAEAGPDRAAAPAAQPAPASAERDTAKPTFTLRLKFPPGRYLHSIITTGKQNTIVSGKPQPTQDVMREFAMLMTVRDQGAGTREVRLRFDKVKLSMAGQGMMIAFDSDQADAAHDPTMAMIGRTLIGAEVVVLINAAGEVTSVAGADEMWDELVQRTPGNPVAATMKIQMGAAFIKHMITSEKDLLCENPVAPGDAWKSDTKQTLPFVGDVGLLVQCGFRRLDLVEGTRTAVLEYVGRMHREEPKPIEMGAVTATLKNVNYKYNGSMRFDIEAGMTRSGETRVDGTMEMVITPPAGPQMPMVIAQDMLTRSSSLPAPPDASPCHADVVRDIGPDLLRRSANKPMGKAAEGSIPKAVWTEGIRKLNPIRVYGHRVNIVCVLKSDAHCETGVYLYRGISSYLPRSGTDGFVFTPIDRDIYRFKRTLAHAGEVPPREAP